MLAHVGDYASNYWKLADELTNYPDSEFRDYLLSRLSNGFHTGLKHLPATSFICRNLRSTLSQPQIVAELILSVVNKDIDKGFLFGPFDSIPFQNFLINPIGIAEGKYSKKKRLIVDLSAPHKNLKISV